MANTYKALQTVTVGAGGVASVTFSSIPNTYTDLVIKVSGRGTTAAVYTPVLVGFNGDIATLNWPQITEVAGTGSAVANFYGRGSLAYINGTTSTASTFSNCDIYISNYNSQNFKPYSSDSVIENNATATLTDMMAGAWFSAVPISSILLQPQTGSFAQYSTFTLYGVFNADVSAAPSAPSIGTATDNATSGQVSVAFTPVSNAASYTMTSSPGSITATGTASPVVVSGLTNGTAYTFTCVSNNPFGSSVASTASNSATPTAQYNSIATVSYPSGTGGDVVFYNVPSVYRTLQIRMFSRHTRVDNSSTWFITFNEDTSNTYSYQGAEQTGSGSISSVNELSQPRIQGPTSAANTGASRFGSAVINIFDANQTNKFKTMSYQSGFSNNNNGGARLWTAAATWQNTSAIRTIRIAPNGAFAQYSHIALYGIG
jgi:hypothetical protein